MKASLITPVDIRYSYKATEYLVYEYAKSLFDKGLNTEILITNTGKPHTPIKNYKRIAERYKKIPKREVRCRELVLPFKYHLFLYSGLPDDSIVYLPFSIYDYIINILRKPKGQKYIIGCHGMHLKMGHIVRGHDVLERMLNAWVKFVLYLRKGEMGNLYCHAVNREQAEYMKNNFNFRPENIFYVPIMINASDCHIKGNNSRKLRVVHVGGMGKDMQIVLDIVDRLDKAGKLDMFEFYFIGERSAEAEATYRKFGNVHFLGMISDNEKFKVLSEADSMIVPAYETFSKAMLEGLVSGLYILTSRKNGTWKDCVDAGIKMYVSETGDPSEYTRPLLDLSSKKATDRKAFDAIRRNKQIAVREFNEKAVLGRILMIR